MLSVAKQTATWEKEGIALNRAKFIVLPAGLGGNGEFERKSEEIWEEIIQNEVSLGGSFTINVTLALYKSFLLLLT